MKIKKLAVKNYKIFDHLELDLTDKNGDVLDTVVFAGLNGSGKTTVLELLADLINGNTPQYLTPDTEFRLEILFEKKNYISSGSPKHSYKDDVYLSVERYSEDYDILIFEHKKGKGSSGNFSSIGRVINGLYETMKYYQSGYNKPAISQAIYFYPTDKQVLQNTENNNVIRVTFALHNQSIRENILKIVQQSVFLNPNLTANQIYIQQTDNLNKAFKNIDIASKLIELNHENLIFESTNGRKIGFDDLSSGEKMLYFIAFTFNQLNPENALIMVDQPEDSLHPTWQQQIVHFFQNIGSNNQVIFATHSPQIIASVRPESLFVLGIDTQTRRVTAHNMAAEHKHTHGVDPNRILSEIMGTPLRDYQTQQKINRINDAIKQTELDPSVSNGSKVEKMIAALAEELGKQDAAIMRFNNELRLLKRKMEVA